MEKKVVELFAGVGGFRVGLNNIKKIGKNGKAIEHGPYTFVWSNQWEPSTKKQYAFECYNKRFPDKNNNSNVDICQIDKKSIPNHTLLTGGFPCQDYSVARSISQEKGIEGKKGVLWWQINEILLAKKPPFVLLENVDRLIKSPAKQRGRDFAIMLRSLSEQGYGLEWRVINAADYGHPQRRRRIFLFAFHETTKYYKQIEKYLPKEVLLSKGIFATSFPVLSDENKIKEFDLFKSYKDLLAISNKFSGKFENTGLMLKTKVYTFKTNPVLASTYPLSKIVERDGVSNEYFLDKEKRSKFKYLRGAKKIPRVDKKTGHKYIYSEGSMSPYDDLNLPSRTMLTSEGSTNRSTHIILDPQKNKLRLLTPVECERLNQFPDNWTDTGMSKNKRYFMMGNALVCGVISKLGKIIEKIIEDE